MVIPRSATEVALPLIRLEDHLVIGLMPSINENCTCSAKIGGNQAASTAHLRVVQQAPVLTAEKGDVIGWLGG